jgi:putative ABC transport system permease protein
VRYFARHRLRSLLLLLGIALGVAVMVSIDIANQSVSRSFALSTELVTGRASHQIVGNRFEVDQEIYRRLRVELGFKDSAPVITGYARAPSMGNRIFRLMGVDPFAETQFRDMNLIRENNAPNHGPALPLMRPGHVAIDAHAARRYGIATGDEILIDLSDHAKKVTVAALMQTTYAESAGDKGGVDSGMIYADIATAQELLGMGDRITRIDLFIPEDRSDLVAALERFLPSQVSLVETGKRNRSIRKMSRAFETNLFAFGILALFLGMFLIYNTVSFSVAQRRRNLGILRCLGVTRGEIFRMIMGEILFFAMIGAALGVLLGILLGTGTVRAVSQTVSTLYFHLNVVDFHLTLSIVLKGFLAGILAACLAGIPAALDAGRTRPVTLLRIARGRRIVKLWPLLLAASLVTIGAGLGLLTIYKTNLSLCFAGIFMLFLGEALLVPIFCLLLIRLFLVFCGRFLGVMEKMAIHSLPRNLGRTSVAMAALMTVISVFIGISTMTGSFKTALINWIEASMQGDIIVSAAGEGQQFLAEELIETIAAMEGIGHAEPVAVYEVFSETLGSHFIFAARVNISRKKWLWKVGDEALVRQRLREGWILVSEVFAFQMDLIPGQDHRATLNTARGPQSFPIAGVFQDFFTGGGRIILHRDTAARYWDMKGATDLGLTVVDGEKPDEMIARIQDRFAGRYPILVEPLYSLRNQIVTIFERTFLITIALQILSAVVAFIGIINAVVSILLDRLHEIGVLRANGMTRGQLLRMMMTECAAMGMIAGLLAVIPGIVLSWLLIHVVNKRSFGWSFDLVLDGGILAQGVILALTAALIAGLYPAVKTIRMKISDILYSE